MNQTLILKAKINTSAAVARYVRLQSWQIRSTLPGGISIKLRIISILLAMFSSMASAMAQSNVPVVSVDAVNAGDGYPAFARYLEGSEKATFQIRLSESSTDEIKVTFSSEVAERNWYVENDVIYQAMLDNCDVFTSRFLDNCSAAEQTEFVPVNRTVVFAPGETQKNLSVVLKDDVIAERSHVFRVRLSEPVNARLPEPNAGPASKWLVFIDDDDTDNGNQLLSISLDGFGRDGASDPDLFREGVDPIKGTVDLSEASSTPVEVTVFTVAGSATEGDDYLPIRRRLVFQPGETSKEIAIELVDDQKIENTESFNIELESASRALITKDELTGFPTVQIFDNDGGGLPAITLATRPALTIEGDTITLEVSLSKPAADPASVFVYSRPTGSAEPGKDFWGFSRLITFDNSLVQSIEFTLLDDDIPEPTEQLEIRLVNPVNATIENSTVPINILDDDSDEIEISVRPQRFAEGKGSQKFGLALSRVPDRTVKVRVFTQDLYEAKSGKDFWGFSRIITFEPGTRFKLLDLTILDDTETEGTERIAVRTVPIQNVVLPKDPYIIQHVIEDDD